MLGLAKTLAAILPKICLRRMKGVAVEEATSGWCPLEGCEQKFTYFMIAMFILSVLGSTGRIGNVLVALRWGEKVCPVQNFLVGYEIDQRRSWKFFTFNYHIITLMLKKRSWRIFFISPAVFSFSEVGLHPTHYISMKYFFPSQTKLNFCKFELTNKDTS